MVTFEKSKSIHFVFHFLLCYINVFVVVFLIKKHFFFFLFLTLFMLLFLTSFFLFLLPMKMWDHIQVFPLIQWSLTMAKFHLYLWLFCVHILFLTFCEKHVEARTLLWFFKFGSFSKQFNTFCMSLKLSCLVLLFKFNRFWMNLLVCFKSFLVLTILSICVGERIEGLK